jgi:hypothetical protein
MRSALRMFSVRLPVSNSAKLRSGMWTDIGMPSVVP